MKGVRRIFTFFWADTAAVQAPCAQNHLIATELPQSPVATAPAQTSSVRCADSFPRGEAFWNGDPKPQTGGQPRLGGTAANLRTVPSDRRSDSEGPAAARAAMGSIASLRVSQLIRRATEPLLPRKSPGNKSQICVPAAFVTFRRAESNSRPSFRSSVELAR